MKPKKQVKTYFDTLKIPSASKLLPAEAQQAAARQEIRPCQRQWGRVAAVSLCLCVVTIGLFVGLGRPSVPPPVVTPSEDISPNELSSLPAESEIPSAETSASTEPPEESESSADSPVEPPETIKIIGSTVPEEFAGDMYRPDGYHEKIGSALAIMLSMNAESETRFNVLVTTYDLIDLKAFLLETLEMEEAVSVELNGSFAAESCYVRATEAQIQELTRFGLRCSYIGSGLGSHLDVDWETEEGKRAYCELFGDLYTFSKQGISYDPDIGTAE